MIGAQGKGGLSKSAEEVSGKSLEAVPIRIADGHNIADVFVGYLDVVFLFEIHDQFDQIQGICPDIVPFVCLDRCVIWTGFQPSRVKI